MTRAWSMWPWAISSGLMVPPHSRKPAATPPPPQCCPSGQTAPQSATVSVRVLADHLSVDSSYEPCHMSSSRLVAGSYTARCPSCPVLGLAYPGIRNFTRLSHMYFKHLIRYTLLLASA